MRKNPSTLEPIEDMSINEEINNSNNLSIFNEQNNSSMASFEQHELTQCTPMSSHLKAQSNSTPMSNRMNDLSHQSSDVRNYFDNLVSSTSRIHTNNHNPSHKEEDMVSSLILESIDNLSCCSQDKSGCTYCSQFYSAREHDTDKYQSYFVDLNGNKISDNRFNLKEFYKKRLANKSVLSSKSIKLKRILNDKLFL